jgi:flagellar biosynthesis protein FlhB
MAGSGGEKTEAPTPKKLEEAKKQGQVAKSADLNGAVVLIAGLWALASSGGDMVAHIRAAMTLSLGHMANSDTIVQGGLGTILRDTGEHTVLALMPVALACAIAGVLVNVGQVGLKLNLTLIQPKPKKMNPVSGFKNIYGPNSLAELGKNLVKVGAVAAIVAAALLPQLTEMSAMVGISAQELSGRLVDKISGIARQAAAAYIVIGLADFAYQKWRTKKQLKMDKQEVKDEAKSQELPPEVKGAIRRRQMAGARARMMAEVPTADVVVTNPTHYSVALRYDGTTPAPQVIAKGQDLLALKIRAIAAEHRVPVVPDPPLARSLHAAVEVGQQVPEELFEAVAQVLAYVYRIAAARRAVAV